MPTMEKVDWSDLPAVITRQHLRLLLGCSREKLREILLTDGFPVLRHGAMLRVSRDAFREWLGAQRLTPREPVNPTHYDVVTADVDES